MKDRDHLDLMATTFVDGDASEAFFGDRWRMSRDVLADGDTSPGIGSGFLNSLARPHCA